MKIVRWSAEDRDVPIIWYPILIVTMVALVVVFFAAQAALGIGLAYIIGRMNETMFTIICGVLGTILLGSMIVGAIIESHHYWRGD